MHIRMCPCSNIKTREVLFVIKVEEFDNFINEPLTLHTIETMLMGIACKYPSGHKCRMDIGKLVHKLYNVAYERRVI